MRSCNMVGSLADFSSICIVDLCPSSLADEKSCAVVDACKLSYKVCCVDFG